MSPMDYSLIAILVTFAIALVHSVFRAGHLAARVEEIERWRISVRLDLHELSSKLEALTVSIKYLATLIEERTARHRQQSGEESVRDVP